MEDARLLRDCSRSRGAAAAGSLACLLLAVSACGGDDDDDSAGADAAVVDAAPGEPDAAAGFTTLMTSTWSIPPHDEIYQCERLTVDRDMYIRAFHATTPLGSHHSVLTVGSPDGADGATICGAGNNRPAMIFGAGVATNAIELPPGVAMKVPAGQQLLLNLHLYNTDTQAPLEGVSTVEVIEVDPSEVEHEAEVVLMGRTLGLTVPPGPSTQIGRCVMNGDVTLFMVNPHMHKLGAHMKVVAERAGQEELVLHDDIYDFNEQSIYPIDPVEMRVGDAVRAECGYLNDTGETVIFGDSSDDEMCFATTYRYPAFGSAFGIVCDDSI
jgi:copper type II ascorbate-dependent monooxygenase-like protein